MPVRYSFEHLTPAQIIVFIESALVNRCCLSLKVDEISRSQGDQLAALLTARVNTGNDDIFIEFVAQAELDSNGVAKLWFRYGVDEGFCGCPLVMDDFQTMILEVLEMLSANDLLLSAAN
jgi:Flp pilus assembly secretin CpaC